MLKNQTIWTGDNLPILRGLDSETIDLIYLDPPFNSNRNYSAPIGSEAAGAAFKDTWTLSDCDNAWHGEIAEKNPSIYEAISASELTYGKSMKSYLIMMAVRLIEMKRLLKDTGSIYLHCDPTASHYLKILMDAIFGIKNFRNEVIWSYRTGGVSKKWFGRKHDVILFFARSNCSSFNTQKERSFSTNSPPGFKEIEKYQDEYGRWYTMAAMRDVWEINAIGRSSGERTGYPTQKPIALLERIIKASSNEGDVVLDPFCGCATALVAAEKLGRRWIGIDLSPKAVELVTLRMRRETNLFDRFHPAHRTDIPNRTDGKTIVNYRTHKHELFGKQEGFCNGCKHTFQFRNLTVDHIVPQSLGGADHPDNLQLLCGACNSMKGVGTQEELVVKLKDTGVLYR